jgi:thioredoxin-related protein
MTEDIVWGNSLRSALELARAGNKLVLATFFSPTCEPCIKMKKYTLLTERVQEYIKTYFTPLKYESGIDSDQFMRFEVVATPTMIVFDYEGNEIFRKIGYCGNELFIGKLEEARKEAARRAEKSYS